MSLINSGKCKKCGKEFYLSLGEPIITNEEEVRFWIGSKYVPTKYEKFKWRCYQEHLNKNFSLCGKCSSKYPSNIECYLKMILERMKTYCHCFKWSILLFLLDNEETLNKYKVFNSIIENTNKKIIRPNKI